MTNVNLFSDPAINSTLSSIYKNLRGYSASRGFELVLSNLHNSGATNLYLYDESKWLAGPLEAQGSDHALSANCIAEITRQSGRAYLIPLLSLGSSLGTPLVPLTIESQDFGAALATAQQSDRGDGKQLLEKWYALDDKAQPACYRLRATVDGVRRAGAECEEELSTNSNCRSRRVWKRGQRN